MEMLAEAMGVSVHEVKEIASADKVTGAQLPKALSLATPTSGKFNEGTETT